MMVLVSGNIVLRKAGYPVYGAYDFACYLTTVMVAFSLAYCAIQDGHTRVELLMAFLPRRGRLAVNIFTGILGLSIFVLITWQSVMLGNDMRASGELSMTSLTPFYPYIYAIAFGCGLLCLVLFLDLVKSILEVAKA